MLTLSYDYGKITDIIKIKLSIIVEEPKDLAMKKGPKIPVVDRSNYCGAEYFRVAPHPFITIDISGGRDKSDDIRNPGYRVNLNRMYKHIFTEKIKQFISYYLEKENLFYYDKSGKLKLDTSETFVEEVRIKQNGTVLRMSPIVVYTDPEVESTACEGAYFMINTPDYGCMLTFDELSGLYNMLHDLNMDAMAMQLLQLYQTRPKDKSEDKKVLITPAFPTRKPIDEEKSIEPPSHNIPAQTKKSIPDLE